MPVVGLQCRYDYMRREGNFERSAGLQVGVDTIEVKKKKCFIFMNKLFMNNWLLLLVG